MRPIKYTVLYLLTADNVEESYKEKFEKMHELKELEKVNVVYSSTDKPAIKLGKKIAEYNELILKINPYLAERKIGNVEEVIEVTESMGDNYNISQMKNTKLKVTDGESVVDVHRRMKKLVDEIMAKNPKKRIVIVTHDMAIKSLLLEWCKYDKVTKFLTYLGKPVISNRVTARDIFKITLDKEYVINLERIINI